jgi:coatomer subunit delta
MVIISATICDKTGKILVARQYQNITKMALEENIKNFPKSIISTQQHTFVENNNLRYVYLPIDVFYLVLLTNKNSNMIEDLETIRLLHKLVLEQCSSGVSEATILKKSLDIVLCFDDVISFGYRESVTFAQVS